MTFAEALARIEECARQLKTATDREAEVLERVIESLALQHTDSIVQLGKVAERMRSGLYDDERGVYEYDKLMKGE